MTITGTAYFTSMTAARRYYSQQWAGEGAAEQKLESGEIFIGKPELKEGEKLLTIDNGMRYAIEF